MFDNDIGEQRSDKYIIRIAIAVYGWDGRLKACQTLAVATGVALRMMMVLGALLLYGQVLLHANHSVRVVMMGNNGCHQHDNVDKKQQSYYDSFFPFILRKDTNSLSSSGIRPLLFIIYYFFSSSCNESIFFFSRNS